MRTIFGLILIMLAMLLLVHALFAVLPLSAVIDLPAAALIIVITVGLIALIYHCEKPTS